MSSTDSVILATGGGATPLTTPSSCLLSSTRSTSRRSLKKAKAHLPPPSPLTQVSAQQTSTPVHIKSQKLSTKTTMRSSSVGHSTPTHQSSLDNEKTPTTKHKIEKSTISCPFRCSCSDLHLTISSAANANVNATSNGISGKCPTPKLNRESQSQLNSLPNIKLLNASNVSSSQQHQYQHQQSLAQLNLITTGLVQVRGENVCS